MKKTLHRLILSFTAMLVMALTFGTGALADDSITIGMDQYKTQDGKIIIYANHNQGENFNLDMEESAVVVGKQNLTIERVAKFKEEGIPASYMFVVDISGSMDKNRIEAAKEIISMFLAEKKDGDNYCVVTMGDELTSSGFLEDTQALYDFVNAIEVTRQDTDLYTSVKEELNVLQTDKNVHDKRCLVILSDGADDQAGGITKEEAETQVKDAHIPVFTVALLPENYKDSDLESAKILGSFARYSAGGEHYVPKLDGFAYTDVYEKITDVIDNSLIITADLAEVAADDGNIYLGIQLSDGLSDGKDGMQIPAGDILDAVLQAQNVQVNVNINKNETKSEETQETQEAPATIVEEADTSGFPAVIAAAVLIALAAVVILVLALKGSRKKKAVAEDSLYRAEASGTVGLGSEPKAAPVVEKPEGSGVRVTLFKVGPGVEESYPLVLDGKKAIGRKGSCDLCFEKDNALSGVHCFLFSANGRIYVQDNHSTNGTFINGVPIMSEYCVENGDVLLIGSAEYRIVCD